MNLSLNDEQFESLIKMIGQHHFIKFMMNDNDEVEKTRKLLECVLQQAISQDMQNVVDKVFVGAKDD